MRRLFPASQYSQGRSRAVSPEILVNLYAEMQSPGGKDILALYGRPGLVHRVTVGSGPIRGCRVMGGLLYAVSGTEVYKIDTNWLATKIGDIAGTGLVTMSDNGTQMAIVSNGDAWVATSSSVTTISDPDLPDVYTVDYLDGYTIFSADDGRFYSSNLLDATDIDPLDFATAESYPDGLQRVFVDHREGWLFGAESTEVWYNAGATNPPFARFNDAVLEKGIFGRFSVTKNDNTVFWLANDGVVYRALNYSPQRISTHAVEKDVASWSASDTEMFSFTMEGHTFVILSSVMGTWVFDASTSLWTKWRSANRARWIATSYSRFAGHHVVGDYQTGEIYTLDLDTYTDNGDAIRAEIQLPMIHAERERLVMHAFEVDIESGVGLTTGQGSDPQIMMQYSDDGFTWSSELWRSMGRIGEYKKRAIWRMVGPDFRQRSIRLAVTDPVKRAFISCYADMT